MRMARVSQSGQEEEEEEDDENGEGIPKWAGPQNSEGERQSIVVNGRIFGSIDIDLAVVFERGGGPGCILEDIRVRGAINRRPPRDLRYHLVLCHVFTRYWAARMSIRRRRGSRQGRC